MNGMERKEFGNRGVREHVEPPAKESFEKRRPMYELRRDDEKLDNLFTRLEEIEQATEGHSLDPKERERLEEQIDARYRELPN